MDEGEATVQEEATGQDEPLGGDGGGEDPLAQYDDMQEDVNRATEQFGERERGAARVPILEQQIERLEEQLVVAL